MNGTHSRRGRSGSGSLHRQYIPAHLALTLTHFVQESWQVRRCWIEDAPAACYGLQKECVRCPLIHGVGGGQSNWAPGTPPCKRKSSGLLETGEVSSSHARPDSRRCAANPEPSRLKEPKRQPNPAMPTDKRLSPKPRPAASLGGQKYPRPRARARAWQLLNRIFKRRLRLRRDSTHEGQGFRRDSERCRDWRFMDWALTLRVVEGCPKP